MAYTFEEFKRTPLAQQPHYFVTGHPISHSLSPVMHQTALDYYGLDARYHAIDLKPDELTAFIAWCNSGFFLGCNITIPYKERFMEVVDETDPAARHIGVINTVVKENGFLKGYNTDAYGFIKPLEPYSDRLKGGKAIIFGTGGASRAVKAALEDTGIEEMVFVTRNPNRQPFQSHAAVINLVDYNGWQAHAEEAVLLINTTPLGMQPDTQRSPVQSEDAGLLEDKVCYDLVYNPVETLFLKLAAEHGADTINGLDMLILQGSRSFELWTGRPFPVSLIRETLTDYFLNR